MKEIICDGRIHIKLFIIRIDIIDCVCVRKKNNNRIELKIVVVLLLIFLFCSLNYNGRISLL